MNILLRLEQSPQHGIYRIDHNDEEKSQKIASILERFDVMKNGPRHPMPYDDTLFDSNLAKRNIYYDAVFYGFGSENQLRSWFYSDDLLRALGKMGCTLVAYKVGDLIDGNAQAAALKKECDPSNVLWRISLEEYLEKGIPTNKSVDNTVEYATVKI